MGAVAQNALENGLPYTIAFLGIWLVFRLHHTFDLAVGASFTLGGVVFTRLLLHGWSPWAATVVGALAGILVTIPTYALVRLLGLSVILSSIIVNLGMYSIALAALGSVPNVSVIGSSSIPLDVGRWLGLPDYSAWATIVPMAGFSVVVYAAIIFLLQTEFGLALRAAGLNPRMARSNGIHVERMLLASLVGQAFLAGLAGGLVVQTQGFVDVNMGATLIIYGITGILLGELLLVGRRSTWKLVLSVFAGSIVYELIIAAAFREGVSPTYFQLVTALVVIAAAAVAIPLHRVRKFVATTASPVHVTNSRRGWRQSASDVFSYRRTR